MVAILLSEISTENYFDMSKNSSITFKVLPMGKDNRICLNYKFSVQLELHNIPRCNRNASYEVVPTCSFTIFRNNNSKLQQGNLLELANSNVSKFCLHAQFLYNSPCSYIHKPGTYE